MIDYTRRTWVDIDLDAIQHNLDLIRRRTGSAEVMCVVKADAYGHGVEQIALEYQRMGVKWYAVSNIEEHPVGDGLGQHMGNKALCAGPLGSGGYESLNRPSYMFEPSLGGVIELVDPALRVNGSLSAFFRTAAPSKPASPLVERKYLIRSSDGCGAR